ncbi:hypothetical protein RRG08_041384 [Elysia crispata]|uniref:Uncharacterized protein n=1 Tax=Elysia crispata TaxID=231223 RepID=A0AAE0XRB4_9GAST|nr:hypothetical protein RRG08_041384 [Elysia crispata]
MRINTAMLNKDCAMFQVPVVGLGHDDLEPSSTDGTYRNRLLTHSLESTHAPPRSTPEARTARARWACSPFSSVAVAVAGCALSPRALRAAAFPVTACTNPCALSKPTEPQTCLVAMCVLSWRLTCVGNLKCRSRSSHRSGRRSSRPECFPLPLFVLTNTRCDVSVSTKTLCAAVNIVLKPLRFGMSLVRLDRVQFCHRQISVAGAWYQKSEFQAYST